MDTNGKTSFSLDEARNFHSEHLARLKAGHEPDEWETTMDRLCVDMIVLAEGIESFRNAEKGLVESSLEWLR